MFFLRFFSFSFFIFLLLAFLLIILVFCKVLTFGQVTGDARDGRSRHRPTNQSFRVGKVHLATVKVAQENNRTYVRDDGKAGMKSQMDHR